jgi:hypothetical protein
MVTVKACPPGGNPDLVSPSHHAVDIKVLEELLVLDGLITGLCLELKPVWVAYPEVPL